MRLIIEALNVILQQSTKYLMSVIKKQTIVGTIYSYMGVAVGTLTMALIIPNYFSSDEYGVINHISRWVMILAIVMGLGFNNSGNRFFGFFREPSENHRGYLFNGVIFLTIGSLVVAAFLYFCKDWIQTSQANDNALFIEYYWLILPITISIAYFNLFDNYAKGLFDTVFGTFLSQLFQRVLILAVALLYIFKWVDFEGFMYCWTGAMSAHFLLMVWHCKKLGNFSLKPSNFLWNSPFKIEFLRFAMFSVITGISSIAISTIDSMMVYKYLGLSMSGIYNFCLLFGSVMTMSYLANVKASTPIVMGALQENDIKKIEAIYVKSGLTQLMFGTVILVLVWVSIDACFSLVKPEYLAAKTALLIIGVGKLYDLGSGVNSLILAYSRYYKLDSFLVISFIGLLYLLNKIMIPSYGLEGAAYATLIATVYYNTARNLLIWKYFRIHPYSFKQVIVVFIGLIVLGIGFLLPDLKGGIWFSLISIVYKSMVLLLLFIVPFYFLKISPEVNEVIEKGSKVLVKVFVK